MAIVMNTYAVIGLGYVGLGLATALAKKNHTWDYDIEALRIQELQHHVGRNKLIDTNVLEKSTIIYTDNSLSHPRTT